MPHNEAGLLQSVLRAIAKAYPQSWAFKVVGGPYQMAGVPDLLLCVEGRLFGLELKFLRPSESKEHALGRATPAQRSQIARINRAGGVAAVVTSAQEALDLIKSGLATTTGRDE